MARIEQVERDKLTARQQALYDDIMHAAAGQAQRPVFSLDLPP